MASSVSLLKRSLHPYNVLCAHQPDEPHGIQDLSPVFAGEASSGLPRLANGSTKPIELKPSDGLEPLTPSLPWSLDVLGGTASAESHRLRRSTGLDGGASSEDKVLIPGVVTHKAIVLEHPETVAQRIVRYADAVGRENVIAGTDCGLGGRTDPQIAWAKLTSLSEGARLASGRLWSPARVAS